MIFDKLEKLGIRERAALVVAVVALLAVLGDRLVVQAFDDALEAVHTRHETQRKRLNYSRVVMERDEDVSAAYREVADLVDEGTAPAVDIDKMKGEIDDLARKSGLVLVSMKHREPRSERHYDVYAVDIGGFDVRYGGTAHLEETDVCMRVRALGYQMRFEPSASLTHLSLQTGGCREHPFQKWIPWENVREKGVDCFEKPAVVRQFVKQHQRVVQIEKYGFEHVYSWSIG